MASGEGEDGEIGRGGDGHDLVRRSQNYPKIWTKDKCRLLCVVIGPFEQRKTEIASMFSQICAVSMANIFKLKFELFSQAPIFRIRPPAIYYILTRNKMSGRKTIDVAQGENCRYNRLLRESSKKLIYGLFDKVVETLNEVYLSERRLCWEIKIKQAKINVYLLFCKYLLTYFAAYLLEREVIIHSLPQGSILEPLLYLLLINDLPGCVHSTKAFLCADDRNLIISATFQRLQVVYKLKRTTI